MHCMRHVRAALAAGACLALLGCASTRSDNQVMADAAAQRVYKRSATVRTSTPQARRMPTYPAARYRAPSVRTYAAAPRARSAPRRSPARRQAPTLTTRSFGAVPPPPPPPPINGTYTRTTSVNPARAPAAAAAVIRPASRPARSSTTYSLPSQPTTPAVKPLAPVSPSTLFRDSGSRHRAPSYGSFHSPRRSPGRACKT